MPVQLFFKRTRYISQVGPKIWNRYIFYCKLHRNYIYKKKQYAGVFAPLHCCAIHYQVCLLYNFAILVRKVTFYDLKIQKYSTRTHLGRHLVTCSCENTIKINKNPQNDNGAYKSRWNDSVRCFHCFRVYHEFAR